MFDIVLISTKSPMILGIYSNGGHANCKKDSKNNATSMDSKAEDASLVASLSIDCQTSKALPLAFGALLDGQAQDGHLEEGQKQEKLIKSLESTKWHLNYAQSLDPKNKQSMKIASSAREAIGILSLVGLPRAIYYARGAGSLSALKLTHIFLQTLSIARGLPLHATNIFYFHKSNEIKAFGNQSFFYLNGELSLKASQNPAIEAPCLPEILKPWEFNEPLEPLYVTTAI